MIDLSRQELVLGKESSKVLAGKKVVIVGVGALGTVAAELLVRAGIGSLILIDRDVVEASNLQRQTLFTLKDVGRAKAQVACEKLLSINPNCSIISHVTHLCFEHKDILAGVDLVLDGTDNLATRFFLNDYCHQQKIAWVYAAAIETKGYVMPILPQGVTLQSFLQEASLPTCAQVGVVNMATTSIAALQVSLGLQLLLGKSVEQYLYYYDVFTPTFKKMKVTLSSHDLTAKGEYQYLEDQEKILSFCAGRYQIQGRKIDREQLKKRLEKIGPVIDDGVTLKFKDLIIFQDGRVLLLAKSEEDAYKKYDEIIGG